MTTLEVLAPYLPYGIEADVRTNSFEDRGKLIGITSRPDGDPVELMIGLTPGCWKLADVTPVLRSFEDLCTSLEDGSVSAIEVAKLLLEEEQEWRNEGPVDWRGVTAEYDGHQIDIWVHDRVEHLLTLWPNWQLQDHRAAGRPWDKAYAYLRKNHFAVGLKPEQYIRKTAA